MKIKNINFKGTTFIVGKKIKNNTKTTSGFFFNKYVDLELNKDSWYFIRIEKDWLSESKNVWIEYYVEVTNLKKINKFFDSVDKGPTISEESSGDFKSIYYEAITLKNTLENL